MRRGLVACVVVVGCCWTGGTAWADGPGVGTPAIVALGDSAISGEAGRWAGNTNDSSSKVDALGPTAYWDTAYWDTAYWDTAYWDTAYWDANSID